MALSSFKIYTDAGLTTPLTSNLLATQASDGSSDPVDFQLWLGSTSAGKELKTDTNPGTNQITLSITDTTAGVGHLPAEVKLALTQGALTAATGGAPLNLGTSILSGVVNAVTFWIRVDDATGSVGQSTELGVTTPALREYSV